MTNSLPKILVTGGSGQLASAIISHEKAKQFQIKTYSHHDFDITDLTSATEIIQSFSPDIIINCAAYTAVDKAESELEMADKVNHIGAKNLAIIAKQQSIFLIHLSTDYVFNGTKQGSWIEEDATHPINVYGETKLAGEIAIREQCDQHIILRVSGIVSEYGHNFLKTMLRLARERDELRIVSDQITCPTSAHDIADALLQIAAMRLHTGTYHYCGDTPISWHEFAVMIINEARRYDTLRVQDIKAINTQDYPTPAKRPTNSVLNCTKIFNDYGITQPNLMASIKQIIARIYQ